MVDKNFDVDDLVWAKMKGYPPWPARIAERTKPPLKKKHHHFVYFFGSKNHAWILDEYITPHCQSKIDNYVNKKTLPALRVAIDEIAEYSKSLLPTSSSDAEVESSDEVKIPDDVKSHDDVKSPDDGDSSSSYSDDLGAVLMTRNDESLKPGPKKSTGKSFAMYKKDRVPEIKRKSSLKTFKKGNFGTKKVRFETNFQPKSRNSSRFKEMLKIRKKLKPKAAVRLDKDLPGDDPSEPGVIRLDSEGDDDPDFIRLEVEENVIPIPAKPPPREHPRPTSKKIGFLGLGMMGINLVNLLVDAGHVVVVWDKNVRKLIDGVVKGAYEGLSPSDVTEQCDIIFSCFYDSNVIDFTVYDDTGILQGLGGCNGTKSYVEMTCVGEQKSKDIAEVVNKHGGKYLEAQLNGSIDIAENGNLIIFASGDKKTYDDCQTVFHAIAQRTFYTGAEVGGASSLNVLCNMFAGSVSAALAEGMTLADRVGLPKFDIIKGLSVLGLNGPLVNEQGRALLTNKFDTSYFLKAQQRDMYLGLQMGNEVDHVMPVTAAAKQSLIHAKRHDSKSKDSSALYMATRL